MLLKGPAFGGWWTRTPYTKVDEPSALGAAGGA